MSNAVVRAMELRENGTITEAEFNELVNKDADFERQVEKNAADDEAFAFSLAFGESWEAKRARIKRESPEGHRPGWDLIGVIIKSNDDLRQEICALQLIELSRSIFQEAGLPLYLKSYRIIATDATTGAIEVLTNAISIDALKKRQLQQKEGVDGKKDARSGLPAHFQMTYGAFSPRITEAKRNFASSLAAYSVVCYVFSIKDRHNGNILLDTEGHLIHIDFGFILGIAPGGAFSIETAPFKMTNEMVAVLGDVHSKLFAEFTLLFCCGFLALQAQLQKIVSLIEIMCDDSPFPCFQGKDKADVIARLHARLR